MTSVILLVKEQKAVADYWLKTFTESGHTAIICNTNEGDVLQAIRAHLPATLFIEARFGNNRGFEIARQAKLIHPTLRGVVCLPVQVAYYPAAIQTDVNGYLPETIEDPQEVFTCLNVINQGYRYVSPVFHRALYRRRLCGLVPINT
ncbi:hypothetical protein [Spirosoma sp.]|uniref:hypothetical protein n=1 Tax=Spirosoma sp. TaxID=1899569 RepID=UPI003B3B118E